MKTYLHPELRSTLKDSLRSRRSLFSYDDAGRLTDVTDTVGGQCTTRDYGFDVNSNRTSLISYDPDTGTGACQTSIPAATTTSTYTAADRPVLPGTGAYDAYGRTTTLPAALTSDPGAGDVTIGYHTSDLVASLTRGTTTRAFTLDPAGRLACSRSKPTATSDSSACGTTITSGVTDTVNHYDGLGDSPAWTLTRTGSVTPSTSRDWYVTGLDGGLVATVTTPATGPASIVYSLTDLHGDITVTTTPEAAGSPDGPALDTDEYGNTTTPTKYGWLGTHQRETDISTGITLMGVRLYTPTTGRFLSIDPTYGGNATTYGYPVSPLTQSDISGGFRIENCTGARSGLRVSVSCVGRIGRPEARVIAAAASFGEWWYSQDWVNEVGVAIPATAVGIFCGLGGPLASFVCLAVESIVVARVVTALRSALARVFTRIKNFAQRFINHKQYVLRIMLGEQVEYSFPRTFSFVPFGYLSLTGIRGLLVDRRVF